MKLCKNDQQVTEYSYAKPHFIEELGEEGLTAREIAASLGVPVDSVHQKLKRNSDLLEMPNWRVTTFDVANKTNGLSYTTYALNTRAAKAFVAKYDNAVGRAYLDFLFECEVIATDVINMVKTLEHEVSKLKQQKESKQIPKKIERKRRTFSASALDVLPGFPEGINFDLTYLKVLNEMSQLEVEAMKILKLSTIGQGIAKAHTEAFANYAKRLAEMWGKKEAV